MPDSLFRRTVILLQPSLLSAGLCIGLPLVACGLIALSNCFSQSGDILRNELYAIHLVLQEPRALYNDGVVFINSIPGISYLPIAIIWSFTGLVAYFTAMKLFKAFYNARNLENELHHVHARPTQQLEDAGIRFSIRLLASMCSIALALLLVNNLIPQTVAAIGRWTGSFSYSSVGLVLLYTILLLLTCNTLTVLLRCAVLRLRVFGEP